MINRPTPKIVYMLGYAGLIPFLAGAMLSWFEAPLDPFFVVHFFIIYSIVIQAFLYGSWWGFAFSIMEAGPRNALLIGSNVLLLVLWVFLVFFQNKWTVAVLGLGYLLMYIVERLVASLPVDRGYRAMRLVLTLVVIICHISVYLSMS